jgi:hypothetical protein
MGFKKPYPKIYPTQKTLMGQNPTQSPTNPTRNVPDGLKTLKIEP